MLVLGKLKQSITNARLLRPLNYKLSCKLRKLAISLPRRQLYANLCNYASRPRAAFCNVSARRLAVALPPSLNGSRLPSPNSSSATPTSLERRQTLRSIVLSYLLNKVEYVYSLGTRRVIVDTI